jgi:arsenite methyltransferase
METLTALDTAELEARVKSMYREVADEPESEFHFETGRGLAERLGYSPDELDRIPAEAIESFAGVGYFFDLIDVSGRDGARPRQRFWDGRAHRST